MKRQTRKKDSQVTKRPRALPGPLVSLTEDLPNDCLFLIFKLAVPDMTVDSILQLFTVSKKCYKVLKESPVVCDLMKSLMTCVHQLWEQVAHLGHGEVEYEERTWRNYFFLLHHLSNFLKKRSFFFGDPSLPVPGTLNELILLEAAHYQKNMENLKRLNYNNDGQLLIAGIIEFDMKIFDDQVWNSIEKMVFIGNILMNLPSSIGKCTSLQVLKLPANRLCSMPPELANCVNLRKVDFSRNMIHSIPIELKNCKQIEKIDFSRNGIEELPDELFEGWDELFKVDFEKNHIKKIPKSLFQCDSIGHLNFSDNQLTEIPEEIGLLDNLDFFWVDGNKISFIHENISNCDSLETLNISRNELEELPDLSGLPNLEYLFCFQNPLKELPLLPAGLSQLICNDTKIKEFSNVTRCLNIRFLFFGVTEITEIPDDIGNLIQLIILELHGTKIKKVPESIGGCACLESLNVSLTQVTKLPQSLGNCHRLRAVFVKGLKFTRSSIPNSLKIMAHLEILGDTVLKSKTQ